MGASKMTLKGDAMTPMLFIKLLRDIKTTWGRMVMMVVAISLSLVAFSSMLYARSIVDSNIASGYSSINPSSARIVLEPGITPDQIEPILALAKAEPGVIDATLRSVFTLQMQKQGSESIYPLEFFVASPDDPMQIAKFNVVEGSWPPPPDGILMERSALQFLQLKVGDNITVTSSNDTPIQLKITGIVHDPSLAPAYTGQQGYGFISTDSLKLLGKSSVLDQLAITVANQPGQIEPSRNRETIIRTALSLADHLKEIPGLEVEQVAVPPPYEHPHQTIANSILLALLAFGALSLLLSAILIATMFNGMLTQQIPQIGILKAIGARSSRILQLYLIMILVVAGTATTLAFAPSIAFGRALGQTVLSEALNMDATSLAIPVWAYVVVIGAGIFVPLLLALVPLIQASRKTVREALDDRGVDLRAFAANRLDTWLGKLRGVDRILLMAFRNMFRRRARFLLSVGLLATAGAIFVGGLNTMVGMQSIPDQLVNTQRWDVEVRLGTPSSPDQLKDIVAKIPGVAHVETWTRVHTGIQYPGQISVTRTYPDQGHGSLSLTAVPLESLVFNPPPVLEGRWLRAQDIDSIVIPQTMRQTSPDVRVGDTIQLPIEEQLTNWQVVGIVKELGGATCPCVSSASYEKAIGRSNQANLIRIVTDRHDLQSRIAVGEAAKQALADASIKAQYVTLDSLVGSTEGHSILLIVLILLAAAVIGVVGLIGLGSNMSTSVIERTREFGVMSAIGALPSTVRQLVMSEGIFIAIASCLVGAVPALVLTLFMATGLGNLFFNAPLPFRVSALGIVIWIVLVVLGAALSTLAAAYQASQLTVREALAYL